MANYYQRRYGSSETKDQYAQYIAEGTKWMEEMKMTTTVPDDVTGAAKKPVGKIFVALAGSHDYSSVTLRADSYTYDPDEDSYDFWVETSGVAVATVPHKRVLYIEVKS